MERAVAVYVGVVVLVVGLVLAGLELTDGRPAPPSASGDTDLRLPERIFAPGAWSRPVDAPGPVAAVALAPRSRPEGLTGDPRMTELFAVSALDGRSSWLDVDIGDPGPGQLVLSPDGRWVAWSRSGRPGPFGEPGRFHGYAVLDTTTGEVVTLKVPFDAVPAVAFEPVLTAGSPHLLVSVEPAFPRGGRRDHQLLALDVLTGETQVLEPPGERFLPSLGSSPAGAVWSRGRTVHRVDLATGRETTYDAAREVVVASFSPGDTTVAYVGQEVAPARGRRGSPWRLYAGPSVEEAELVATADDLKPSQLLGWVDEQHVVVGYYRSRVDVVDVTTGEVVRRDLEGSDELGSLPVLASDLWQNPLRPVTAPADGIDPRWPWRGVAGAMLLGALGLVVVVRRRGSGVPR